MQVVPDSKSGSEVERAFHQNMPDAVKDVLNEFKDVFLADLPPVLQPV